MELGSLLGECGEGGSGRGVGWLTPRWFVDNPGQTASARWQWRRRTCLLRSRSVCASCLSIRSHTSGTPALVLFLFLGWHSGIYMKPALCNRDKAWGRTWWVKRRGISKPDRSLGKGPAMFCYEAWLPRGALLVPGFYWNRLVCDISVATGKRGARDGELWKSRPAGRVSVLVMWHYILYRQHSPAKWGRGHFSCLALKLILMFWFGEKKQMCGWQNCLYREHFKAGEKLRGIREWIRMHPCFHTNLGFVCKKHWHSAWS